MHHQPQPAGPGQVVALGHAPGGQGEALLGILLAQLAADNHQGLVMPRVAPEEVPFSLLESWGFRRTVGYTRLAATAQPG